MKKAFIQLHVAVFLAGLTAILGKLILLNEGLLVFFRMAVSAIALGLFLIYRKELILLPLRPTVKLFAIGTNVALHWVCFYGSIKYANISVALTCLSAVGFFTALAEPFVLKKKMDIAEVCLGLLAIAGIYLIFSFYPQYKTGIIFGVLSAALASLFPILNTKVLRLYSPRIVTLYEMAGGALALVFVLPFYLRIFPAAYYIPTVPDGAWLIVLALFCTVLPFILQLNALRKISAFTVNLSYNLEPVYGIILAFIIFHENKYLTSAFYYGFSLILLAVLLQTIRVMLRKAN